MKKYTPPKKEFLMLPNSVFDMPLDVYAFKIYASAQLEKVQNHIHRQTTSAVFGLFRGLAGMIQTSANHFIRRRNSIDRKQRQKIEEKKRALGQRSSGYEYDYNEEQTM